MKNTHTMNLYKQQVVKAAEEAEKIKLDPDFNKSMKLIGSYPILTQYIKLSDVLYDWFDSVIKSTNDSHLMKLKDNFVLETVGNLAIFSETGDVQKLRPIVTDLKSQLNKLFMK